jgi:hypothetical protein
MTHDGGGWPVFAEAREYLGGFNLIEAANMDEAVRIAQRFRGRPWAATGCIEVRPVWLGHRRLERERRWGVGRLRRLHVLMLFVQRQHFVEDGVVDHVDAVFVARTRSM